MFRAAVLVFLMALLPIDAYGQDKVFNILYTGALKGELEPCGCSPKTESGGLARLSGHISASRGELKPYILVDAGNSMGEDTAQGRLKTEAVLRSIGIMGYNAAALSERDASLPAGFIDRLIEKHGARVVAKGVRHRSFVPVELDSFKVNISADPKGHKRGWVNVLLTDKPVSEARAVKGWDVIVTSSGEMLDEPVEAGKTIVVSGYPKGKMLGVLSLRISGKGRISGFTHGWQPLGRDVKEDADVREVLNEYGAKVAALLKDEERTGSEDGPYLGDSNCAQCHQPFMDGWKGTRHAGAFNSLEKAGKSRDPECVGCHTTGYGEEGGFYSKTATPGLANVQCEACHGPGKEHASDFTGPMKPVDEPVCLRCHSGDNSPDFEFGQYLEKIKH